MAALAELGEGAAIALGAAGADVAAEGAADTGVGIPVAVGLVAASVPWWGEAGAKISHGWNGLFGTHPGRSPITGPANPAMGVHAARKPDSAQPAAMPQYSPQPGEQPPDSRSEAFRKAKRDLGIPMSQQPDGIRKIPMKDRDGNGVLDQDNNRVHTRVYDYTRPGKDPDHVVIQDHSSGHDWGGEGDQPPHFNTRPRGNERTGKIDGTKEHYPFKK